ncbi:uncharacterized protein LOC117912460 [Vitis riparia]|uniref:uncharacterized protein LOC117912460 n=1 Tax=Vitis riparia TaxID=96939 RepID=UPI00155AAE04|nr:uncharacterized protein LOC117912460 [Vitis riparia]
MKSCTSPCDTHINLEFSGRHTSVPDQVDEPIQINVPLLLQPSYARSKSSIFDELRHFRMSLKWCALDHSSWTGKSISCLTFIVLAIIVPILSSLFIEPPSSSSTKDPISFNKLVQLPESGLAAIAFFTLSRFFQQYGLRHLLFLDDLMDDSLYVRRGYTRELDKAFRFLTFILLPSLFVELAHKILFFSTVRISIPHIPSGVPLNSIAFVLVLATWIYRTGLFLLVCVLFRLTCELQILRFEGFQKLLEGCGSDAGVIFREHMRIRKQLSVTSHRYRFFIIGCLITITVSQLGALLIVLASKSNKTFFNSGDLVVCSAVQLSGFLLCLLGAARITHRAQRMVSVATRWHMLVTCATINLHPDASSDQWRGIIQGPDPDHTLLPSKFDDTVSDLSQTLITVSSQDLSSFQTSWQALVTYLQHNSGGITLFGFTLDRGLLHTIFAFEFSLVMWILSKVVVLS